MRIYSSNLQATESSYLALGFTKQISTQSEWHVYKGACYIRTAEYSVSLSKSQKRNLLCSIIAKIIFSLGLCWLTKQFKQQLDFYKKGARSVEVYTLNPGYGIGRRSLDKAQKVMSAQVKPKLLEEIRNNHHAVSLLEDSYWSDGAFMLEAIKLNSEARVYITDSLRKDKRFILDAVAIDPKILELASDTLKDDKEVLLKAVSLSGYCLFYASDRLKDDRDVVKQAVSTHGTALMFATERYKAEKEIVSLAVESDGHAFVYASDPLKDDEDVVKLATSNYPYALQYATYRFKNDRALLEELVKKDPAVLGLVNNDQLRAILGYGKTLEEYQQSVITISSSMFNNDFNHVMAAVKKNPDWLKYASFAMRDNKEIVLAALEKGIAALIYVSDRLKNDKEVVLRAQTVMYSGEAIRNDRTIALQLKCIDNAGDVVRGDRECVMAALETSLAALTFGSSVFRNDRDVILKAAALYPDDAYRYASSAIKKDNTKQRTQLEKYSKV